MRKNQISKLIKNYIQFKIFNFTNGLLLLYFKKNI
jgi:hypothetical protein